METIIKKQEGAYAVLKERFNYRNIFQSPQIDKVVISVGTGRLKDKKQRELIEDRLQKITGQKPAPRPAKKSIAAYKTREGDIVGYQVTLRGGRSMQFLEKFFNVALPRTRDFRGISAGSVDGMGNLTIGLREHTIFPETSDEDVKDVFGMAIGIVTTAPNREEALAFFEHMGVPFQK